jgi:hypothetical protein
MSDYFGAMGTALLGKLASGTALIAALGGTAIYGYQAPSNTEPPFVVFSHQGGGPQNLIGGDDLRDDLWFVRAYATEPADAHRIDGLISDLLHRGELTVPGWTVFWCVRETNLALVENLPNNEKRFMAGAFYRVRLT